MLKKRMLSAYLRLVFDIIHFLLVIGFSDEIIVFIICRGNIDILVGPILDPTRLTALLCTASCPRVNHDGCILRGFRILVGQDLGDRLSSNSLDNTFGTF